MSPSRIRAIHSISGSGVADEDIEGFNTLKARLIVSSSTLHKSRSCRGKGNIEGGRELAGALHLCQVDFVKNFTNGRFIPDSLRKIYEKVVDGERITDAEA